MSSFRRFELLDSPSSSLYRDSSLWCPTSPLFPPFSSPFAAAMVIAEEEHQLGFALDLLDPRPKPLNLPLQSLLSSPASPCFKIFDTAADLVHFWWFQEQAETELQLRSLCDHVIALELRLGRPLGSPSKLDQKFTWTPKIKGAREEGFDRKYKWVAKVKGRAERNLQWTTEFKVLKEAGFDRKYKWMAEKKGEADWNMKWMAAIKGKGKHAPVAHTYTFQAASKRIRGITAQGLSCLARPVTGHARHGPAQPKMGRGSCRAPNFFFNGPCRARPIIKRVVLGSASFLARGAWVVPCQAQPNAHLYQY